MNFLDKINTKIFFIFSLFFLTILYFIPPKEFGSLLRNLHTGLFFVFLGITPFSLIFIFLRKNIWKIWFKFSIVFSFLGFLFITFSSTDDVYFTVQGLMVILFLISYSLISIGILIYGLFKKNKPENTK